jgi:cellulose synthase/poly-beta-1,6-N-acetylglucosamine synthase-like glycosyltransferase
MRASSSRWMLVAAGGALLAATGLVGFSHTVLLVSFVLQGLFVVYFARHLAFAITALRSAPDDLDRGSRPVPDDELPRVSVVVACRDEETVVDGLVRTLLRLDYPRALMEVVLVDDGSTDRTGEIIDGHAAREGFLRCIHRPAGAGGGKSGALNAALGDLTGEIVVVFDADHAPRPDAVRNLVRHFADPAVGAAQGRCVIGNHDDSLLARLVWIDYLGGYLVNEYGRQSLFQLPAYGGANCAVRLSSLRALGGWNEQSVTEDTDLTLRLLLRGERVRYDVDAVDAEEGVVTLDRFWRQRYRWARGHQQAWRDYGRAVWACPRFSMAEKAELIMFLFAFHLPVASALGLLVFAAWLTGLAHPFGDVDAFVFWTLLFLGPLLELGAGLLISGAPRRSARMLVFFIPIFFVSIALCTKAWLDAVRARPYEWDKTDRRALVEVGA